MLNTISDKIVPWWHNSQQHIARTSPAGIGFVFFQTHCTLAEPLKKNKRQFTTKNIGLTFHTFASIFT